MFDPNTFVPFLAARVVHLDDQPAVVSSVYGKDRITYISGILDDKLMGTAASWMAKESGLRAPLLSVPDGVEVSVRSGSDKRVIVLINFAQETKKIGFGKPMKLLLSERRGETVELAPYGVEVLQHIE